MGRKEGVIWEKKLQASILETLPPHPGLLIVLGGVGARRDLRRSA